MLRELLWILALTSTVWSDCPPEWSMSKSKKFCLSLMLEKSDWAQSDKSCRSKSNQSRLASVTDDSEQSDLMTFLTSKKEFQGVQYIWVGLTYDEKEKNWHWVDKRPYDLSKFVKPKSLWMASQPDNEGTENCGLTNKMSSAQLMDMNCDLEFPYVCQSQMFGEWTTWSDCSITCGQGVKVRKRICPTPNMCAGAAEEEQTCKVGSCPVWTVWSEWTECSKSCGGGQRHRKRECTDGPGCVGESAESDSCATQACAEWSSWGSFQSLYNLAYQFVTFSTTIGYWDSCSQTCGSEGKQKRIRTCIGSNNCPGVGSQERNCNQLSCHSVNCPVNFSRVGQSCYEVGSSPLSFTQANSYCDSSGARLVTNLTAGKMCFINKMLENSNKAKFWSGTELGQTTQDNRQHKRFLELDPKNKVISAEIGEAAGSYHPLCELEISSTCYADWENINGSCYRKFPSKTADEALQSCLNFGGSQPSILSESDWTIMQKFFKGKQSIWLGLNDIGGLGWSDGSSPKYLMELKTVEVLVAVGHNDNSSVCFLMTFRSGKYRAESAPCAEPHEFICKTAPTKKSKEVCRFSYVDDLDTVEKHDFKHDRPECPNDWELVRGATVCSCWRLMKVETTYDDAEKYCQDIDAYILIVRDIMELEALQRRLKNDSTPIWLGYTARKIKGKFQWTHRGTFEIERHLEAIRTDLINTDCSHIRIKKGKLMWMADWCYNLRMFGCRVDVSCEQPTTMRPYPTMNPLEKVISQVVQTLGCTAIIGILASTIAAFLILRNFSIERCLAMSEEISLLCAHLLIMSAQDNYGNLLACTVVAIALHYFFAVLFTFLLLESIQAYIIVTSVIPRGSCLSRWRALAMGWFVPAVAIGLTAIFHHSHYVTPIMCFLDLEGDAVGAVLAPILIIVILAIIIVEAAGMGEDFYPKLQNHDKTQMTTNKLSQKGLVIIVPLGAAAWLFSMVAISQQNFGLFTLCFGLNISLAIALLIFHALSNPEVRYLFIKAFRIVKNCLSLRKKRVEDGSFEADYKAHNYRLWNL